MRKRFHQASLLAAVYVLVMPMASLFAPRLAVALGPDPILINSCEDLNAISVDVDSLAASYKLNADIDCAETATSNINLNEWVDGDADNALIPDPYTGVTNNGYSGFEPIGGPMDPFTGTFDGNGKTISNLWIFRKETSFVGLFGYTDGATIQNLTLDNSSIVGGNSTGGLAGSIVSTIVKNVTVSNSMTRAYLAAQGGGLVGVMYHNDEVDHPTYISESHVVSGVVHGSGNIIGGLVGSMNNGQLVASSTTADVDGGYSIGGAVGEMQGGTISGVAVGEVTVHSDFVENNVLSGVAKNGDKTGGFIGYMNRGAIEYSSTSATVEGEGNEIGGFAGRLQTWDAESPIIIQNVTASGPVAGLGNPSNDSRSVGGFIGVALGYVEVSNSTASGNVTSATVPESDQAYSIGGFSGQSGCGVTYAKSSASGSVTAPDASEVGGFTGWDGCEGAGSVYSDVRATGAVTGQTSVGGLIGSGDETTITESSATGIVSGVNYVGGLIGYLSGAVWTDESSSSIARSFALGSVLASGDGAGGLVGFTNGGFFSDSYAKGNVTGNRRVGGLIGEADGSIRIQYTYATGALAVTNVDADPDFINGLIGDTINVDTNESLFYPSYFDQQTNGGVTTDDDNGSLDTATPKNTNQMTTAANTATFTFDPDPSPDIDGFDFTNIWEFRAGENADYPMLIWQSDPVGTVLCEQASMTATTGRISCDVTYEGDVSRLTATEWNATDYRKAGDLDWTAVDWVATTEGKRTFTGLDPDTTYQFRVHVVNNAIDYDVVVGGTTLAADSDLDGDGILDIDENLGPNNGDANNDGLLDSEQDAVTTISNQVSGSYSVLETSCGSHVDVSIDAESSTDKDPGFSYSAGLMSFTITDCPSIASVTQYNYGSLDPSKLVARKYDPITRTYSTIAGAVLSSQTIGGQSALKISYQVQDNGPLDQETATGTITDPSGPGSSIGVPNTGLR